MGITRQNMRTWATRAFLTVAAAIILGVIAQWFIQVATDKGWYAHAGQTWDRLVTPLIALLTSAPVLAFAIFFGGFVTGLWADALLKPKAAPVEARQQAALPAIPATPEETPADLKVRYPHQGIVPLIDGGITRETEYGKEHYKSRIIDIPALFGGQLQLHGLVFEDCVLAGPAVLNLDGAHVRVASFLHEFSSEELFIEITDERGQFLISCAYQFVECTIRRCTFYRCGFIGTRDGLSDLRNAIGDRK